jgi:GDP-D-mannose dehydratase
MAVISLNIYLILVRFTAWSGRKPRTVRWLQRICEHVEFVYGDLRDNTSLEVAFRKAWPDEVYNLASQVFFPSSWEYPSETFDINVGG